ncbi:MAG: P-II family nitrogen regulator [Planctomycetota bacterium]|jgi:nitrogen regulatory protein PII
MKKLTLVVKPFKVDAVVRALLDAGAFSLTLTEARGYGRQKGHLDLYRDDAARVTFLPKVRLECAVDDDALPRAIEGATAAARTGRIGDGKIFVEELA